jgi:serine-type D-Ala-D-Ala carboxypeptidase/endopeptidase (penicillin-binding protein 4)
MLRSTLLLLMVVLIPGCATVTASPRSAPARSVLIATLDSIMATPPVQRATWGVLVQDARSGDVLYSRNAEQLLIPASNMKLVVTTAALGLLGPDWRYATRVLARPVAAGTTSHLIVTGSGDPSWSARFHDSAAAPLDSIATLVQRSGIREVGELVIDVSRFRDEPIHPTWEVSDLPGVFAPPVDAFAAADGTFRLALAGGLAAGLPGTADVVPPFDQPLHAEVSTDTAGAARSVTIDFLARRDTIFVRARVGAGARDTTTHAVTRPARTAAAALEATLRARGVTVGAVRIVRDSADVARALSGAIAIGAVHSPPLSDIVAAILRPSQNWISEQLLKTLGAELGGAGSWSAGHAVQRRYLIDRVGLDSTSFQLRDASGMSAQNLLTATATVGMLAHARGQSWYPVYRDGLAQPGLSGSTLASRLRPLDGRLYAKTGSITNVNSLSGYLQAADGRELLFAILTNGSGAPAAAMRGAIDGLVLAIARWSDAGGR